MATVVLNMEQEIDYGNVHRHHGLSCCANSRPHCSPGEHHALVGAEIGQLDGPCTVALSPSFGFDIVILARLAHCPSLQDYGLAPGFLDISVAFFDSFDKRCRVDIVEFDSDQGDPAQLFLADRMDFSIRGIDRHRIVDVVPSSGAYGVKGCLLLVSHFNRVLLHQHCCFYFDCWRHVHKDDFASCL